MLSRYSGDDDFVFTKLPSSCQDVEGEEKERLEALPNSPNLEVELHASPDARNIITKPPDNVSQLRNPQRKLS